MMTVKRAVGDISREKLFFISIFVFLLVFPYSVYGYFAFFPDIFSVLAGYWIVSDERKSYGMILIAGIVAFLQIFFGGDFLTSLFFITTALFVSFFPSIFPPHFIGVVRAVFILSFFSASVKFEPLFDLQAFAKLEFSAYSLKLLKFIFFVILKILASLVLAAAIYPLVYQRKREIIF